MELISSLIVLFLADMRVEWSAFKHSMVASDCLCTIVTENPHTPESFALRELAHTVPIQPTDILEHLVNSIPHRLYTIYF